MEPIFTIVTESKLVLLASRQANTLRRVVGARNSDIIGKPMDQEDGRLVSQKTDLTMWEFRILLYEKGKGYYWLLPASWSQNPLFLQ